MIPDDHDVIPSDQISHAIEAEQALLGCYFVYNGSVAYTIDIVGPEHFYEPVHARIFQAITSRVAEGRVVTPMTIAPEFRHDESLAHVGGVGYLARLCAAATAAANAGEYARVIRDCADRRQALQVMEELRQRLSSEHYDVSRSADGNWTARTARTTILDAVAHLTAGDIQKANAAPMLKSADLVIDRCNDALMNGVADDDYAPCGSSTLADAIGGWRRKRFYVIGGRPAMGKTTVALSWLLRTASVGAGHGVLFFSLEMGADELAERALCDLALSDGVAVPYYRVTRKLIDQHEMGSIITAKRRLEGLPLIIDDRPALTVAQIRATVARQKAGMEARGKRLEVVCIDHMGLVRASERYAGNKVAETEEVSAAMKAMAKEFDVAVIALLQLNRGVEGRESKRPSLADLRWSGAIEQDADCAMFVFREAYYLAKEKRNEALAEEDRLREVDAKKNVMEIIIDKQRGGPTPTLTLWCDLGCAAVRDEEPTR